MCLSDQIGVFLLVFAQLDDLSSHGKNTKGFSC